ncbi:MAG: hypothetical protein JWM74_4900 [Myxococcaceae bacterium]|nr:hypothetical protein [Myxococcaceae bacterium]
MNWKFAVTALALGCASLGAPGCSADAGTEGDEMDDASQDELRASAAHLVGAYHAGTSAGARPPTFDGLVLNADGSFFADVDTGIRCIMAPCPSNVRLTGKFSATKALLRLLPAKGEQTESFHGTYSYAFTGKKLSLTRTGTNWKNWSNDLTKGTSYCSEASDCDAQGIIHPMCVGSFTCGSSNACAYRCGIVPVPAVYPTDASKVVAHNAGGGFTPPPPAGSDCAVGASTYTLDRASKKVVWEQCELIDWQTPLKMKSGTTTLTAKEMATVEAALNGLTISHAQMCGADKPYETIAITSTSQGTKKYTDSFYSCDGKGPYVDNIGAVFSAFRDAVQ